MERTKKQELNTKEIAQEVRSKLKKLYPGCKFSVVKESYSMGSSIHCNLMEADFKVIKDFSEVPEEVIDRKILQDRYTKEQLKEIQEKKHHQLNNYTLKDEFDPTKWCNGVFLTEKGHKVLGNVVKIFNEYNWDNSDIQTDYFDVNFYLHMNIGKWDKDFVEVC